MAGLETAAGAFRCPFVIGVIVLEGIPKNAALRLLLEGNSDNTDVGDYGTLTWTFTWKYVAR